MLGHLQAQWWPCQSPAFILDGSWKYQCIVGMATYGESHGDVIKWKHFPRYWPFVREFTGHRWIPRTKASDAELWCFTWSPLAPTVDRTMETPSRWLWRHCNEGFHTLFQGAWIHGSQAVDYLSIMNIPVEFAGFGQRKISISTIVVSF